LQQRLKSLKEEMEFDRCDSFIITNRENVYYMSGFTGTSGVLFVTNQESFLITDFRYTHQAKEQVTNFDVVECGNNMWDFILEQIKKYKIKNTGFECRDISYNKYTEIRDKLKGVKLIPKIDYIEKLRIIKDEEEIILIGKAAEIGDNAFDHILDYIKPGVSEIDIALELEFFMRNNGADGLSFDTIVASGHRSALPHGSASKKRIEYGDLLTLDYGCRYKGYCSDMTRTVAIGNISDEQEKLYRTVYEAQKSAREYIKAGLTCEEVDRKARNIINLAGYGKMFGHGLGHGVGLQVHEDPRLAPGVKSHLQTNMVVTIEPGIYIPQIGGVRIEDLVTVTDNGCNELSNSIRELLFL